MTTPESLVARAMLSAVKRKELDSKTFSNDEIILGNFKGKESLPLANRGNTFVSLRGVLEILSKTELSSDIVDNFQDEKPVPTISKMEIVDRSRQITRYSKSQIWHKTDFYIARCGLRPNDNR